MDYYLSHDKSDFSWQNRESVISFEKYLLSMGTKSLF